MTSSVAVFEAEIWVKSVYNDEVVCENQEKREICKSEFFFLHKSNIFFGIEFTAC